MSLAETVRIAAIAMIFLVPPVSASAEPTETSPRCELGTLVRVPGLQEASGVAVTPSGRIWTHNDSGRPVLVSLDERGSVTGKVELVGARIDDWEAIAAGPCPGGSCLYLADIGDNNAKRSHVAVARLPEPERSASSATVEETFQARYPDGPHDAETLLVTPQGGMFIVTKGDTGPVALYRFPRDARPGVTVQLERVGAPRAPVSANDRITDGTVSPDGQWVLLRTHTDIRLHRAAEFFAGAWQERGRIDLRPMREPQGEGIAFVDATTLVAVGEGGGRKQPGTFSRMACTF